MSFWPSSQQSSSSAAAAASSQNIFSQSSLFGSDIYGGAGGGGFSQESAYSQLSSQQEEHPEERCLTCGSSNFVTDDATGLTHCADCHTQSQTLSQVEVVAEEDVEALAARTGGRILSRKVGPKKTVAPDEEIDNSIPLPGLDDCILGFQFVLKAAAERAAELVGLKDDAEGRKVLMDAVKNIWFGYLASWREGAEHYSKLHPELRFSLRDAFIGMQRREMILRHLSAQCCEEIKDEEEKKAKYGRGRKRPRQRGTSGRGRSIPTFSNVNAMLNYLPTDKVDNKIAALRLEPSLTLLGSIIHLALSVLRSGVASHHITGWAASGSFPYLTNAYNQLSNELKKTLRPLKKFFIRDLPPPGLLDYQAEILAIACGMNLQRKVAKGVKKLPKGQRVVNSGTIPGGVEKDATTYADNIALLAARLVSDLGFDQRVLDVALSLIGLREPPPEPTDGTEREWVPLPLKAAAAEHLISPLHVMAVIVVAIRMCEGWEEWTYHMRGPSRPQGPNSDAAAVRGHKKSDQRFVPTSEAQLQMLSNGRSLEGYLDYIEEHHFGERSRLEPFGPFVSSLQDIASQQGKSSKPKGAGSDSTVMRNTIVAGAPNPNKYRIDEGSNAVGKYVIYKSCLSGGRKGDDSAEPGQFHPPYALLIEYMAYKADAEPSDLHNIVGLLDREIFARSCFNMNEAGVFLSDERYLAVKKAKRKQKDNEDPAPAMSREKEANWQWYYQQLYKRQLAAQNEAMAHYSSQQQEESRLQVPEEQQCDMVKKRPKAKRRRKRATCTVEGCTKFGTGSNRRFMCKRHYKEAIGEAQPEETEYVRWGDGFFCVRKN